MMPDDDDQPIADDPIVDYCDLGICPACSGSGEGMHEGTTCTTCKGAGECYSLP